MYTRVRVMCIQCICVYSVWYICVCSVLVPETFDTTCEGPHGPKERGSRALLFAHLFVNGPMTTGSSFESRQRVFPSYISATTRWERFYSPTFSLGGNRNCCSSFWPYPFTPLLPPFTSPYTKRSERAPPHACSHVDGPYVNLQKRRGEPNSLVLSVHRILAVYAATESSYFDRGWENQKRKAHPVPTPCAIYTTALVNLWFRAVLAVFASRITPHFDGSRGAARAGGCAYRGCDGGRTWRKRA